MPEYLLFRLYGPMASWGDIAVAGHRPSQHHPTRSAVLGLVGAALGVERGDTEGQRALHGHYGVGCRVDAVGEGLRDYHTAQSLEGKARRGLVTRREELDRPREELDRPRGKLSTELTEREYRVDALYSACLWAATEGGAPRWSLEGIEAALRRPVFTLYLGRKSCTPGLPPAPRRVQAGSPLEAMRQARFPEEELLFGALRKPLNVDPRPTFYWEKERHGAGESHLRRDLVTSRAAWQFTDRIEYRHQEGGDAPEPD